MTIRWITPVLGTAAWKDVLQYENMSVLDVRCLVDGPGNDEAQVLAKIEEGRSLLNETKQVVICCDWGASRSNAIAAGVLAKVNGMSVAQAFRVVVAATGERDIKSDMYSVVRRALEPHQPTGGQRRVAVVGGGSALAKAWRQCEDTSAELFSRNEIDLLGDLTGPASLLVDRGVTDIVLLAQPRRPFGRELVGQASAITYAALELARAVSARLVLPSSISVFARARDRACLTPEHPVSPNDDFGYTKCLVESLATHYAESRGVQLAIVRFSHIYGPGNTRPTVLVNAVGHILRDQPVHLHAYRNGFPELDLLFIEDAVAALRAIAYSTIEGVVHVGSGCGTRIVDAVEQLIRLAGSTSTVQLRRIDGDVRRHILTSAPNLPLPVRQQTSLESGLASLLKQHMNNRHAATSATVKVPQPPPSMERQ